MKLKTLITSASLLFAAQSAFAVPYIESGDAGDLLPDAQAVGPGTTSIDGFGGSTDVDMYAFTWGGGGLQIDTFGTFTYDTQLFLFDADGFGVLGNDDHGSICAGSPGSGLQSCLDLSAGLAAGTYYLAISAFNNDPMDASSTAMMSCATFTAQCASTGGPLASWTGSPNSAGDTPYTINFSAEVGGPGVPTPEPGILMLMGVGLAGLGFARRRRG